MCQWQHWNLLGRGRRKGWCWCEGVRRGRVGVGMEKGNLDNNHLEFMDFMGLHKEKSEVQKETVH